MNQGLQTDSLKFQTPSLTNNWIKLDEVESLVFPGGEIHIKVAPSILRMVGLWNYVNIDARLKTAADIIKLCQLVDVIKYHNGGPINLCMPYIPYAQQDRYAGVGASFSLKVFTNMLNTLNLNRVSVYEPHSDVAPALINNCKVRYMDAEVLEFIIRNFNRPVTLVAPDGGGVKRTDRIFNYLSDKTDLIDKSGYVIASKTRDLNTGKLKFLGVSGDIKDKDLLCVDDIIIGGGTFIQLTEGLNKMDAGHNSISLFTAHGIYSNGTDELRKYFKHIGTTDSRSIDAFLGVDVIKI